MEYETIYSLPPCRSKRSVSLEDFMSMMPNVPSELMRRRYEAVSFLAERDDYMWAAELAKADHERESLPRRQHKGVRGFSQSAGETYVERRANSEDILLSTHPMVPEWD